MTARERLQQVAEQWFLTEPLLFAVYCSHRLTVNPTIPCAMRTGQGRIEYNPAIIAECGPHQIDELLRVEAFRILLGHPYARQPIGCSAQIRHMASDMVIAPAYQLTTIALEQPADHGLPEGEHYEWYARRLNEMASSLQIPLPGAPDDSDASDQSEVSGGGQESQEAPTGDDGAGNDESASVGNSESDNSYAALWDEDAFTASQVNDIIRATTQWGSVPGSMVELIRRAAEGRIDYRNALRGFRASILSTKRHLTRMRPSRRFGFEQMGSQRDFETNLLVAVDTSGSVGSEELGRYFRIITTFFKYGIQHVDVIMFDVNIQGKVIALDKFDCDKSQFSVSGRGGTNFQAPIDYVAENGSYDGLIIITDGWAKAPVIPPHLRTKLLWIIDNEKAYKQQYAALRKSGRVCLMQL